MENFKRDMTCIQSLVGNAFTATGGLVALASGGKCSGARLQQQLEDTMEYFERAELQLRTLCESYAPGSGSYGKKPVLPMETISGSVDMIGYQWLHICLNTLLPHCRFQTPGWLTDTIRRLLDSYEAAGRQLPYFPNGALLVLDEHSQITGRKVFDQDNKGWKAVSNAFKGRKDPDDDQYSLAVALLSSRSSENITHITMLDIQDAGDFFSLHTGGRFSGSVYRQV